MKSFIAMSLLLFASVGQSSETSIRCEMMSSFGGAPTFEFTFFDGRMPDLLKEYSRSQNEWEVVVRLNDEPPQAAYLIVKEFGQEPGMYKAEGSFEEDSTYLELTYDMWASPIVTFELETTEGTLKSKKCQRVDP